MQIPKFLSEKILPERLSSLSENKFFVEELETLNNSRVAEYYTKIIDAVKLDEANPKNSYVMWVIGKVNFLDDKSPAKITEGRVSLPDIDSDFPAYFRDKVIQYIQEKYGYENVCQMVTYSRMQGRSAMKDVLNAHERCTFEEMNRITEFIPDEAAISDDLQEMLEAGEDPSIIRWALENNAEQLKEWCFIKEDGELDGPLALDFAQAIRLEGTKRSQGKHASGIIISSVPLHEIVPMIYDRSTGQSVVGVGMQDAEAMGLVKFDILGTAVLDKIQSAENYIRTGVL